jgi:acyl-CoA reductase-like NAD-dependent aldehyde dehydrogenase
VSGRCVSPRRRRNASVARRSESTPLRAGSGYWTRDPVGVVAAGTPFNAPLNLVAHKAGPMIAAGDAVIVKRWTSSSPGSHTAATN